MARLRRPRTSGHHYRRFVKNRVRAGHTDDNTNDRNNHSEIIIIPLIAAVLSAFV
jgi:hypothetical protein